jgi:pyruvate dehydrogenase E2 component (dihydrolipoamide acetyltransferase)
MQEHVTTDVSFSSAPTRDSSSKRRQIASPRARRRARELGVDLTTLVGSGKSGRVRERDVLASFQRSATSATALPTSVSQPHSPALAAAPTGKVIKLTGMRKTIAQRMVTVLQQSAPVTLTRRVDATNLVGLRRQFQATQSDPRADGFVPSYTELLGRLVVSVLKLHPELNAVWHDQDLVQSSDVHLAVAVNTAAGLVAPVIHGAERLGLREFVRISRQLVEVARAGRLTAEQQSGGTFTLSNLGMEGVDLFTPIINPPQVAILGVGRIAREPAIVADEIVARDQLWLSLTFDHRANDGAPASRLLAAIASAIENPGPHLV